MSDIIVGTIRGKNGNGSYSVVKRDGRPINVFFTDGSPTIGSDVIGSISADETGRLSMALHPTVLDALLDGHAKIIPISKRPDLTARILAKVLERAKSAVFKPGAGMSIERMPHSEDQDISWAMNIFRPEAERLGLALNVIDVKAVTRSPWDGQSLQNFSLPADIEGSRRSRDELTKILRSGFHPACSRIVDRFTGQNEISINFVIPYAPFAGAVGFARDAAAMHAGVFPMCSMDVSETRKISSARQMALAIAHNVLTPGRGLQTDLDTHPRARHLSNCFADAAAVLAFLANGGRPDVVEQYASLKEASLYFGYDEQIGGLRPGVLEKASHRSVRAAIDWFTYNGKQGMAIKDIVSKASRIAKSNAYEGRRFTDVALVSEQEMLGAVSAANLVAVDLSSASTEYIAHLSDKYRADLAVLVEEHTNNPVAAHRLMSFGATQTPLRMESVFHEKMAEVEEYLSEFEIDAGATQEQEMLASVSQRLNKNRTQVVDFNLDSAPVFRKAF
jgi:hypothetical protein